jgi:cation:H+ antiporter
MDMALNFILFIFGFAALIKGAGVMIDGASSLAKKFGVSSFFIGLTVVAFGTSMPEMIVSVYAGFIGNADIALGNVIGSNMTNTLLILGVSAVITPLIIKKSTINKEIPFSMLAVFAVWVLINDSSIDGAGLNSLTRIDGLILFLFFLIFLFYTFGISREEDSIIQKTVDGMSGEPKEFGIPASIGMIMAGLAGLSIGGKLIVDGAVSIALFFGLSEALISLTIIAIGTSLPELAASGFAAYRGKTDIAIGNVIGSNISNLLCVLGASAAVSPIVLPAGFNHDFIILFAITLLLMFLIYSGKRNILGRKEGAILILMYVVYVFYLIIRK